MLSLGASAYTSLTIILLRLTDSQMRLQSPLMGWTGCFFNGSHPRTTGEAAMTPKADTITTRWPQELILGRKSSGSLPSAPMARSRFAGRSRDYRSLMHSRSCRHAPTAWKLARACTSSAGHLGTIRGSSRRFLRRAPRNGDRVHQSEPTRAFEAPFVLLS